MYLMITVLLIAGAFAIASSATAMPLSPWASHIGATPRPQLGLLQPGMKAPHEVR